LDLEDGQNSSQGYPVDFGLSNWKDGNAEVGIQQDEHI
jgi:hypothetical protein